MAQRAPVTIVPLRQPSADLEEALDAIDYLDAALRQGIGDDFATGLQLSALAVAQRLRRKHMRLPARQAMPCSA